jgi:putative flippase GtrA
MINILTLSQKKRKKFITFSFNKSPIIRQFMGYLISGVTATTVHYVLLIYLVEIYSSNIIIASSVGFLAGAITGFTLNKQFVFCDNAAGKTAGFKYLIMAIISAGINMLLLWIFTKFMHLHYLFSQIIATTSIVLCNFTCCKIWIFNKDKT